MNTAARSILALSTAMTAGVSAVIVAPSAHAAEMVTYEVFSSSIGAANIEYFDGVIRQARINEPLPWRITVPVANPTSVGFDTAEVRADWRWAAAPNRWVTTRIYFGDKLRCENSLDVGNAACYGTTPFNNSLPQ
ncbi:MAG: MmpS family transport accessory protein [Actinomycetota bacterium]